MTKESTLLKHMHFNIDDMHLNKKFALCFGAGEFSQDCFLVEMNHKVLVSELPHAPCEINTSGGISNANSIASSISPISARRAPSKMDQPFFLQNPSCASLADLQLSA